MSASNVPEKLKKLDITRFVHRAAQLEKAKPIVAYWCYYRALQQIITSGLHNDSEDAKQFTTTLMTKVESLASSLKSEDAIADDIAAEAYIEQFALETFQRGDNTIKANKVSRQTADTLQAAATFFDLINVWKNQPSQEVSAKVKYAKFHALRIVKAIKAGEDPNLSNPVLDPVEEEVNVEAMQLDPEDPEVQRINGVGNGGMQASVEDDTASAMDHEVSHLPTSTTQDLSKDVTSPLDASHSGIDAPRGQAEDDYFPRTDTEPSLAHNVPEAVEAISPPPVPLVSAPRDSVGAISSPPVVPAPPASDPAAFYDNATPSAPPIVSPTARAPPPSRGPATAQPSKPVPVPVAQPKPADGEFLTDDVAVTGAQKHAKWAISALNFEDVPTAVSELRAALRSLGAE